MGSGMSIDLQAVKTTLDRAHKAGDTIQGTEDRRRNQMEQAGQ